MTPVDVLLGALREAMKQDPIPRMFCAGCLTDVKHRPGCLFSIAARALAEYERLAKEGAADAARSTSEHPAPWRWEDWRETNGTLRLRDAAGDSVLRIHDDQHSRLPSPSAMEAIALAPSLAALRAERDEARALLDEITRRWQTPDGRWCVLCDHCICTEDCPVSIAKRGRRSAPAATPPTATPLVCKCTPQFGPPCPVHQFAATPGEEPTT